MRNLAPKGLIRHIPDAPLYTYLEAQQLAICSSSTPGAANQRAFVNGDGTGGLNPQMFLNSSADGFANFDAAAVLTPAGTCSSKVYISEHHYLAPCGVGHNPGLVETNTMKLFGQDTRLYYDPTPYTGTIVKLLPRNAGYLLPKNGTLPAFCRLTNTNVLGEKFWVQPVIAMNGVGTNQFLPSHPLYGWQQQFEDYHLVSSGDSGSPVFCGIRGEVVILSFVFLGTQVGADHLYSYYWDIVTKMRELATYYEDPAANTYAPQTVDIGFLIP